jgi:cyclic pyranopterin phosphate synthase
MSAGIGSVVSVNLSSLKGVAKVPAGSAELATGAGLLGDAHAGPGERQVSMLSQDAVRRMREAGADVEAGSFGENLTVDGIEPTALPLGTRIAVGASAVLVVSRHGKVCHDRCAIYEQVGDCVMPREGVFATVESSGPVAPGDSIRILGDPARIRGEADAREGNETP